MPTNAKWLLISNDTTDLVTVRQAEQTEFIE